MKMKIDALEQQTIIDSLNNIRAFVESLEPQKSCHSCSHFYKNVCDLAQGQTPPPNIVLTGCPQWEIYLTPPF